MAGIECNPDLEIVYREDVQNVLRCSKGTALLIMKRTGCAFKVGRRWAISKAALTKIVNGGYKKEEE